MSKFISVVLLLVICFLVGAIVGMEHNPQTILANETETKTQSVESDEKIQETVAKDSSEVEIVNEDAVAQEIANSNDEHLSQKTASFLEGMVQGFYDLVVEVLYQLSQVFF
ncbi:hypothetical protein [Ornithinibacillus scapharcae]|uniref:hypothetical protein n=1 Tax=Ornithinibacillus scapharcae TaxID=1147159 RepID=UPI000225B654|nr:hypothetical protein [Ornithinibacillus scapharcae]